MSHQSRAKTRKENQRRFRREMRQRRKNEKPKAAVHLAAPAPQLRN